MPDGVSDGWRQRTFRHGLVGLGRSAHNRIMGRTLALLLVTVVAISSCTTGDDASPGSTNTATTPPVTSVTPATEPTDPPTPTSTTLPAVPTSPPQTTVAPTSAPPTVPDPAACDRRQAEQILDATIALARLVPGGDWTEQTDGVAFDDRTDTAEGFAGMVAYECVLRLAQRSQPGIERLALIGWNDLRHAAVIQATDTPTRPYGTTIRFQLFLEQPYGEWLEDQFVWAATMAGGESIIVATHDASTGLTAKAWQSAVPPFEDLPVTLDAEQYAIDALTAAGARNVSVAEPAAYGSPIGSIQFHTPNALIAFAAVGAVDAFDPMVPIVADGETILHTVDGVEVRVTAGKELGQFDLFEVGFRCGAYAWRLTSGYGTPDELFGFAESLLESLAC